MTIIFAAFDYDAGSDRVTIITPSGRTASARVELEQRAKAWPSLREDPHALYRDYAKLFLAWIDLIEPASADTKLVIAGPDIIVALISGGTQATLSLSKQRQLPTANDEIEAGLEAIAGFLSEEARVQAVEILQALTQLGEMPTSSLRH